MIQIGRIYKRVGDNVYNVMGSSRYMIPIKRCQGTKEKYIIYDIGKDKIFDLYLTAEYITKHYELVTEDEC